MREQPSRTAEVVAFMRATDARRPPAERLVDDPYARWFLGPTTRAALATLERTGRLGHQAERLFVGLVPFVLARHRYIDDALTAALAHRPIEQIVVLGAGYDARAWRHAGPIAGRPVFEVDHPATAARKARLLARHVADVPPADVRRVTVDFRRDSLADRLAAHGFAAGAPTFFVWEGVSPYLTREAVKGTLAALRALGGAGSELAMDFWYLLDATDRVATAHRLSSQLLSLLGEPVAFGIHPEDAVPFLGRLGWTVTDLADAAEPTRRYVQDGRRLYPACFLVHARARAARATTASRASATVTVTSSGSARRSRGR